ncbi:hypothetical protein [Vineibacter terrae]|uniref:hypothetical protein n=1 Tax=Vineibacter terrae TaxID=2586908 RepID=UPI002E30F905|nr:hypothetical protein [Vineibacter terrae]HEX2891261.1 hypothetical protein [Vineibacter terrae]
MARRKPKSNRIVGILAAAWLGVISHAAIGQAPAPKPSTEQTSKPDQNSGIDGFRSARFGMTEAQVREAIRQDFKLADAAIKATKHPVEQTRVLQVVVRDLVGSSGEAQVAYVLGVKSKTLIQVNVLWTAADTAAAETVMGVANALRDYFQAEASRFKKDSVTANARLPDGRIVVFRGADEKGRAIELILAVAPSSAPAAGPAAPRPVGVQLRLTYVLSPENPDIHRIQPGNF